MTTGMAHLLAIAAVPVSCFVVAGRGHKLTQSVERRVQYAT